MVKDLRIVFCGTGGRCMIRITPVGDANHNAGGRCPPLLDFALSGRNMLLYRCCIASTRGVAPG